MNNHTANRSLEALFKHLNGAYAPNTLRAYHADMKEFIAYCEKRNLCPLPADPQEVASFLMSTVPQGIKASTIQRKAASISAIHRFSGLSDPTKHPEVKLCIRKINRQLGNRFDQAYPVTKDVLKKMLSACAGDLRGLRDRALLHLAYDSMRRRAELVSFRVEDLVLEGDTGACLLLRRSKTDQFGSGRWIHLSRVTTVAITDWLEAAEIRDGYLLRGIIAKRTILPDLGTGQVSRIFKLLAQKANLDQNVVNGVSGHSMRVGAAQDLLREGASLPQIMVKGGWAKSDTVMRYVERIHKPQSPLNMIST